MNSNRVSIVKILSAFFLSTLWVTAAFSHSALFEDYFIFDDSNGGESVSSEAQAILDSTSTGAAPNRCINGFALGYPCNKVDLQAFVPKASMGEGDANLNDIWGWTDPVTGKEIAIVGLQNRTAFVDVTDPANPVFLGKLDSHDDGSDTWRDIKVYNDHAFIVADGFGNATHGLQVFDLAELRSISSPPADLTESGHHDGFGNAHNIVINEDSGYGYAVGSNQCSGGLYMVDLSTPAQPTFAGCFSTDGYTHDAQCVNYNGPDTRYSGREICVGYNEDTITIVDVTNKQNPIQVSRTPYDGSRYTHQGWFVDDNHKTLIMNDELDEAGLGTNTTSYIFDVSNLQSPVELGRYVGPTTATDHNLYARDGYVFESNHRAGLRILSAENIESGQLEEVAYFDVIPNSDSAQFSGTWSSYIYFESGIIVLSDIGGGLFVVKPDWDAIRPNNTPPTLAIADGSGNEGRGVATAVVTLSKSSRETINAGIHTIEGTATPGSDYWGFTRNLRFSPGETRKTVNVTVLNDTETERDEALRLRLFNTGNIAVTRRIATVRIADDDNSNQLRLTMSDQTVNESDGSATITVNLSRPSASAVTVGIHTIARTAVGGQDYYGLTESLRFEPGETVATTDVTLLRDNVAESPEVFGVRLFQASGAVIGTERIAVTIVD